MMKLKRTLSLLCALLLALSGACLTASAEETLNVEDLYKSRDVRADWSADGATVIDLGALESGSDLTLTEEGDYVLSGEWTGRVIIEAGEEAKLRLILNGVSINSPAGPAIWEKSADKLILTLAEGSVNTLTDGAAVAEEDATVAAGIYTEDDLSVNGSGTLTVTGTAEQGIQCKADLIIAGGDITVSAVNDGIRGNNSVLLLDGVLTVTAGGDGIVSSKADKEGKGWIVIAGGTLAVTAGDGVSESAGTSGFGGRGGWGRGWGDWNTGSSDSDTVSQKGVKAATDLTVLGGSVTLNCTDDALHAQNIAVTGGTLNIRTGDDGMHADSDLVISGGIIDISQCHEGLEGYNVTVSGGEIRVVADDDAVNAAGGNDSSGSVGIWGGRDHFSESNNGSLLTVSGGTLSLTAGGDGLDSNGSISVTGGVTGVWTASNGMEGPIDFNGSGSMTGGTLILASSGMQMGAAATLSGQAMMGVSLSGTQSAGTVITLKDANGAVLGSFAPESSFSQITVASSSLDEGSSCEILCGDSTVFSGAVTSNVSSAGGGFGGGRGGWGAPSDQGAGGFGSPDGQGGGRGGHGGGRR